MTAVAGRRARCKEDRRHVRHRNSNRPSLPPSPPQPTRPRSKPCASPRSARRARSRRCSRLSAKCRRTSARRRARRSTCLKDTVTQALAARRDVLKSAALDARLASETVDVTLPLREAPRGSRPHSSDQPGDRRTHRDLRRHGIFDRRRPGHRDRRLQFHQAEFPRRPSGAGDARHVLLQSEARRLAPAVAHAYLAGAGAHDAEPEAADPRDLPGPHLSQRLRPDAYADVPSGRGPRDRQGLASRPPEMDFARILQGVLRGRQRQHAFPSVVLPVHRALARSRHPVPPRQGRDSLRRRRGLAGDSRLRHGASERAAQLRHRSRRLSGLRLGHGDRPHRHAEIRHRRSAAFFESDVRWLNHYGFSPLEFPTLAGGLSREGLREISGFVHSPSATPNLPTNCSTS